MSRKFGLFSDSFNYSGQNIGVVGGTGTAFPSASDTIRGVVYSWFSEYQFANMTDINQFYRAYADSEQ